MNAEQTSVRVPCERTWPAAGAGGAATSVCCLAGERHDAPHERLHRPHARLKPAAGRVARQRRAGGGALLGGVALRVQRPHLPPQRRLLARLAPRAPDLRGQRGVRGR